MINPASIIHPVETHPGAVITAIASRNLKAAQVAAKRYSIERAYGSYEELLQDPEIDAIYISLPNGMHAGERVPLQYLYLSIQFITSFFCCAKMPMNTYTVINEEWAKKAMDAGKHVLIEKPAASNAEEATVIFDAAKKTNRVALEAFHWQFHPAAHVVRSLIESGRYGRVISTASRMTTPANSIPRGDIRWQYDLAGGSLMDMTYVVSSTRYFLDAGTPQRIDYAKARPLPSDKRVDEAMDARMYFKSEVAANSGLVKSDIKTDMNQPYIGHIVPRVWEAPSILIELEHANIYFYKYVTSCLGALVSPLSLFTRKNNRVKEHLTDIYTLFAAS